MADPVIVVEGIKKSYGDVAAVRGISFTVQAGEVFALLGPNGAGKTTTIEILEGYSKADSGTVRVLDMDPSRRSATFRDRIGIVSQECVVPAMLTVREIITSYSRYYSSPRSADNVLEIVGLLGKQHDRIKTLSGGQQRKLDLALALVGDPDVLFLDEPTTGFDPSARRQAWDTIQEMRDMGKTIILTTHYMDEAQNLADNICVIAEGSIVSAGSPQTLGGRNIAACRIKFNPPENLPSTVIPEGAKLLENNTMVIETSDPVKVLHNLTTWAVENNALLANLEVMRPSLEDVYLDLVQE